MKRAAVVANPTKYEDREGFRDMVCAAMAAHGWSEPLWLETTADDPGTGQARTALTANVDLVLASGGDGTVTACAAAIAGSGIPLGIVPAGTGNLLARNLGLPLELDEALVVALTGAHRELDVGIANGRPFIVMAGLGFDARMLDGASEPLALAAHVLLRRRATSRLARIAFHELRVDVARKQPWQLDGEVVGRTWQLVVTVHEGKLCLRVPAGSR